MWLLSLTGDRDIIPHSVIDSTPLDRDRIAYIL